MRCRSALRSPAFVGAADWSLGRFRRDGGDGFLESAGWLGVGKSGAAFAGLMQEAAGAESGRSAPSPLGLELKNSWVHMQREAGVRTGDAPANAESFLHDCPSCLLNCREQGQRALTRQVEEARHGALEKSMLALGLLDRWREAYFNCAKSSTLWVHTWPAGSWRLSSHEFAHVTDVFFGVPLRNFAPFVGTRVGGARGGTLDAYGCELDGATRPGGGSA